MMCFFIFGCCLVVKQHASPREMYDSCSLDVVFINNKCVCGG
jgi:hypothetical protein